MIQKAMFSSNNILFDTSSHVTNSDWCEILVFRIALWAPSRRKDSMRERVDNSFRLTRPCRTPWLLDSEHHDLPDIFRSQGPGARDWCRAALPRRLFSNKTSLGLLEEACGCSPARRCPWYPDPPSPRTSTHRSIDRNGKTDVSVPYILR